MDRTNVFSSLEPVTEAQRVTVETGLAQALRKALGPAGYASWGEGLRLRGRQGEGIVLSSPNGTRSTWLELNAWDVIEAVVKSTLGQHIHVKVVPDSDLAGGSSLVAPGVDVTPLRSATPVAPLRFGAERMTFDRYCVDDSNREAFLLAKEVAKDTARLLPIIMIHGALGGGKTHLLNAVAMEALRLNPQRRVRYMYAQLYMEEFLDSIRNRRERDPAAFKARVRENDLFLLDDVHRLAGKAATEEELQTTIERICGAGGQVMLVADHGRASLAHMTDRLRNQLAGAVDHEIAAPNEALRRRILQSWIEDFQAINAAFEPPENVIDIIAQRHTAVRDMEGAIRQLWTDFSISGQAVTLDSAERSLRARNPGPPERKVTVLNIIKAVAAYYQMTPAQLLEKTRRRCVARPRQVAMYLATQLTQRSLPEIARCFSHVHHTTILFARRRIGALVEEDAAFRAEVEGAERAVWERTAN